MLVSCFWILDVSLPTISSIHSYKVIVPLCITHIKITHQFFKPAITRPVFNPLMHPATFWFYLLLPSLSLGLIYLVIVLPQQQPQGDNILLLQQQHPFQHTTCLFILSFPRASISEMIAMHSNGSLYR